MPPKIEARSEILRFAQNDIAPLCSRFLESWQGHFYRQTGRRATSPGLHVLDKSALYKMTQIFYPGSTNDGRCGRTFQSAESPRVRASNIPKVSSSFKAWRMARCSPAGVSVRKMLVTTMTSMGNVQSVINMRCGAL